MIEVCFCEKVHFYFFIKSTGLQVNWSTSFLRSFPLHSHSRAHAHLLSNHLEEKSLTRKKTLLRASKMDSGNRNNNTFFVKMFYQQYCSYYVCIVFTDPLFLGA